MTQLSHGFLANSEKLLRLDEALDQAAERLKVLAAHEVVATSQALTCVLAADVTARVAVPHFTNSAVDGYAVRFADLKTEGKTILPVKMRVAAGACDVPPLPQGGCARIFTGAPIPDGADIVFMQEDVEEIDGAASLPQGLKKGANLRPLGEDFAPSALVLGAGTRLKPQHIAALVATGNPKITVYRPLRVALFSTGNELRNGTEALGSGAILDANRPMLAALLQMRGLEVSDGGILPDDPTLITQALDNMAETHDVILTSGGVSIGEEDHVKTALNRIGTLDFWRLAIKPGRPIAMGNIRNCAFIGLPGNPAAAFIGFLRFVGPVLDLLQGADPLRPRGFLVSAGFSYQKKPGRREYLRGSLSENEKGIFVQSFAREGAGLISSLTLSDGLIELEENREKVEIGEVVRFFPFSGLMF